MRSLLEKLLMDESGVVISSELALVGTVGVLGMVVGLEAVTSSVTSELNDLASAFGAIDQSYGYRSIAKPGHAWVRGSGFNDRGDACDCIVITQTDVGGLTGSSNFVSGGSVQSTVAQAAVVQETVVNERVVNERVVDEVLVEPATVEECPDDEIIEEHIIRRRVRADCDKTLRVVPKANLQPLSPNLKPKPQLEPMPKSKPQPQPIEPKSKPKKKG